jgi:stage II sporulation protein D
MLLAGFQSGNRSRALIAVKSSAWRFKGSAFLLRAYLHRLRSSHGFIHICTCLAVLSLWFAPTRFDQSQPAHVNASSFSENEQDAALQSAAESALAGREGTVIVMDAGTGRVRALVNSRVAYAETFAPGSAIKPFTELTALRAGVMDEGSRVLCRERFRQGDFEARCSHPRFQPAFNPVQALAYSCNYYFSKVGEQLDSETFHRTLASFGFGARTGVDEDETAGAFPHSEWRVSEALGDNPQLMVTPVQLINAYVALINGGHLFTPQRASQKNFNSRERNALEIEPEYRALIIKGMRGAVAYGTAAHAGLDTLPQFIFGKTGTSTPRDDFRSTHGWFVGFASDKNASDVTTTNDSEGNAQNFADKIAPENIHLAVLVFLKRAHGSECAEAARPIFEEYARLLKLSEAQTAEPHRAEPLVAEQPKNEAVSSQSLSASERPYISATGATTVRVRLVHDDMTRTLTLDDYVFGVLAAEASLETQGEALKAQAVISRTFALKNLRRHARDGFDLCNSTHCQRFINVPDESARPEFYESLHRALQETAGQVLLDTQGQLADAYFSAACGGMTANVGTLWGVSPAPVYLRGVHDEFCAGLSGNNWTDTIAVEQLLKALRSDKRTDVGAHLTDIRVIKHDATGRAEMIALDGERSRLVRGWDFKIIVGRVLGWNVLKSSRFDVRRAGKGFVFRGSGFGHGLGLCQAGAHVMATRGASYRQILSEYLPGTRLSGRDETAQASGVREEIESVLSWRNEYPEASGNLPVESVLSKIHHRDTESTENAQRVVSSSCLSLCPTLCPLCLCGERPPANVQSRAIIEKAGIWKADVLLSAPPRHAVKSQSRISQEADNSQFFTLISNLNGQKRVTLSSESFRANYPSRVARRDVERALSVLEEAKRDVARRLAAAAISFGGLPMLELFMHDTTGDFVGATGQPPWTAAATRGRRIETQPLDVLNRRGVLTTTLRHEYTHALIEALGRGRAPRWLAEGMAIMVAGEGSMLVRASSRNNPMTRDELERGLEHPASAAEMRALYAAAYREVSALVRKEGEASVWHRLMQG